VYVPNIPSPSAFFVVTLLCTNKTRDKHCDWKPGRLFVVCPNCMVEITLHSFRRIMPLEVGLLEPNEGKEVQMKLRPGNFSYVYRNAQCPNFV